MRVLVIGAGYCGLAAALTLGSRKVSTVVAEAAGDVGGLSRTLQINGINFELGPHIYFDKDPEVVSYWRALIGDGLRSHIRRTRLYYNGRYLRSPLSPIDTLAKLGPIAIFRILGSYVRAKIRRQPVNNAEDWVVANFGRQLYERFFQVYNEKIWGLPSQEIAADWAGQRIKASLLQTIGRSILRDHSFVIKTFLFPDGGSASIYEAQKQKIAETPTTELRLNCRPLEIAALKQGGFNVRFEGQNHAEHFTHVISTAHLKDLNAILRFPERKGAELDEAVEHLVYRNLVLVNLVLPAGSAGTMREHWIDIHDPNIQALRVTNFSNYARDGADMPVALGVEYNCFDTDPVWTLPDDAVLRLARKDLAQMGLTNRAPLTSTVVRISRAYPVYTIDYKDRLATVFSQFNEVRGLVLAGRNALFRWNNMHHSVRTGQMAAENVLGASHDISAVRGQVTIGKDSD